jgi:multidrug efflux system outer membrane protein
MGHRVINIIFAVFLTGGCALGPDYRRPVVDTPPDWLEIETTEAASLANTRWWELFEDETLQELIGVALAENKDLRIAVERIEESRALYGFTRADLFPKVDANASAGRILPSEESIIKLPNAGDESLYNLNASLFWEIDLFGRIRRATEAQKALFLATMAGRRAVMITLVSDVARVYMELRDFDRRLEISRQTLESRQESIQLARDRFEGGLTPELDLRQAEAEFYRTQSIVYDFERSVRLKEDELSVLLGRNPGLVPRGRPVQEQSVPPSVPAGLPSDLLERRPDVQQAEEELVAANARIGEAKALLFPRIALTGDYGWETTDLDSLFTGPAKTWSIAANLLQPIFNAGKNLRRVDVAESQQRQALYAYELVILQAFREVEDSLVSYRKTGQQRVSQSERVKAELKTLELADIRYRGGVTGYLEVLDAQRSLFSAQLDEVQTISDNLISLIRLYRALGGGWSSGPEGPDGPMTKSMASASAENK